MTKKDLQREYIKEFGYPKFNKYNNNDYTKWLETKLIEKEKQCAINDVVVAQRTFYCTKRMLMANEVNGCEKQCDSCSTN